MKSLLGYSPWGCKKLDTTEQLIHTHTHTHTHTHKHLSSRQFRHIKTNPGKWRGFSSHSNSLGLFLVREDALEKEIASHSRILA